MSESQSEEQRHNLERGARFQEHYERDGTSALIEQYDEFFHPDYVFRPAIAELGGKEYHGKDGVRDWIADMEAIATDYTLRSIEIRAVGGDHLLVLGRMHLVGRESGAAFESEYAWVYRTEEGLITEGRAYLSHADAERAAEDESG